MQCPVLFLALFALPSPQAEDGEPLLHVVDDGGSAQLGVPPAGARASGGTFALGTSACAGVTADFLANGVPPEGDTPTAAAFTPDGSKIVVAHRTSSNVIVFDAATQAFLQEISVTGSPNDLAISSDGVHAVTANVWEDTVSILDLAAGTEVAVVPVGNQPGIVRITPNGLTAVVGNTVDQTLSVVDVATATETHQIAGCGFVSLVAATFEPGVITATFSNFELIDDTTAVQADFYNDELDFFDLAAGTVSSIPCDADPREIAITPDGTTAVVAHTSSVQRISVVDTATQSIAKTIATGIDLRGPIAIRPDASKAVASVQNAVVVVNLATDAVSPSLSTASVNGLRTTADGDYVLTIGFRGSLVSFASETVVKDLNNIVAAWVGAVSPTDPRGVLIANHNGEDMLVVNTNGAAAFLEAQVTSGPPPEADNTRMAAVSADGSFAVTTNVLSDNASILDLDTGALLGLVDVGNRPADVEITPDGSLAVVANLDSTFVSVIDVAAQTVTNVTTSTRNSEVEISPDGQFAYVAVVVSDGVWRIDLTTKTVAGPKLPAGQMGSVFYLFQQASGMTLSHDGATLVTCDSFDDTITVIDTASWSVVATVAVGDFPTRATFSPDDGTIYVANKNADTISVVNNAGAASVTTGTIAVGDQPFEMVVSPDGGTLYVANANDDSVGVVDLGFGVMTSTVPLPEFVQGLHLNADGSCLYAVSGTWSVTIGPGPMTSIAQAGFFSAIDTASLAVVNELDTGLPPGMLAFDDCGTVGVVPSPFGDGVTRFRVGPPAAATVYGCGVNPAGSMSILSGTPALGQTVELGLDNPLGTQAAGSLTALGLAFAPDPSFPCGTPVPGLGMAGPGAAGELLLSVLPPDPFDVVVGPLWTGPLAPASILLPVPGDCAFLGVKLYAQGVIVDPTFSAGVGIGLTDAVELELGV